MINGFEDGKRFKYRVAGIVITEGKILLHRVNNETRWSLPGGKVEFGESSQEALKREFYEEMGVEPNSIIYRGIIENFYKYCDCECHELGIYYDVWCDSALAESDAFKKQEGANILEFRWFSLETLSDVIFEPEVLKEIILTNEKNFHVINKEK